MNQANLQKIIENYINQFDPLHEQSVENTNREFVKWTAVFHFQKHWDIHASDFASMFKKAVSKTEMLINNRMVQPTSGIVKLAERPELTETIRDLFAELFEEDQGDLTKRQYRIENFVNKVNALLLQYESGKWKYTHDFRTALAYLNLYQPAQNYLLKSTQAHQFRYYIEYGDDFGYGSQFSLAKYYHMCDQIAEIIRENHDLREKHASRLTELMCRDDDFHLLVFDLIYCTAVYRLYDNITYTKPSKPSKTKKKPGSPDIAEVKEQVEDELRKEKEMLLSVLEERGKYDDFSITGLQVKHRKYGTGVIIEQGQDRVKVAFDQTQQIFMLPSAFQDGYLKTDDEEIMQTMRDIYDLDRQIDRMRTSIRMKETKLKK